MLDLKNIKIIKEKNHKVGLLVIDKQLNDALDSDTELYYNGILTLPQFKEKWNFDFYDIFLYGKTKEDVTSKLIENYIDCCDIKISEERSLKSYKCFCGEHYGLDYKQQILHGSALSSWDCIMTSLNNPEYVILFNLDTLII